MPGKNGVFISYSRKDGTAFAADLRQQITDRGLHVWQDITQMEGGRDWWFQITDALDNVEFMVLVATPGAIASPIVRKEWRYARQQGVCVYPVLVPGNHPDFSQMPRWMRDIHFYDLARDEQQTKFFADIARSCEFVKVPFMAEALPDDYVKRSGKLNELLKILLDESYNEPVAITAALGGAGGYGKTVIARALCHEDSVQEAFDDGILWVTLGDKPGKPTERLLNLIEVLTNERPSFTDVDSARTRFREVVADRDLLFVIDDVWNPDDLEPFLNAGPRVAYLITTRDDSTLPRRSRRVRVDSMTADEAAALMLVNLEKELQAQNTDVTDEDRDELRKLAKLLGHWALLLKLARGFMEEEVLDYNRSLQQAIFSVRRELENYGLQAFDPHNKEESRLAVKSTLMASLSRLDEREFKRFTELGIFPEDVAISLNAVEKLWKATGGLDPHDVIRLCKRLNRLSLLLDLELGDDQGEAGRLRLHDVIRTYLRDEAEPELPDMAERFLSAYGVARWADLPDTEDYLWDHLAYHLVEARRYDELLDTVSDMRYLARKIFLRNSVAIEADLQFALTHGDDRDDLKAVLRAIANAGYILIKCASPDEILTNILAWFNYIPREWLSEVKQVSLASVHPIPDSPPYDLIRTIKQNEHWVNDCDLAPDGSTAVATHNDEVLRLWDTRTGKLLAERPSTLEEASLWRTRFTPDGTHFAVSTTTGIVQLWTRREMHMVWSQQVYELQVPDLAVSPDGTYIAPSARTATARVLHTATGETAAELALGDQTDISLVFSKNGQRLYGVSLQGHVSVWTVGTWELEREFQLDISEGNVWYSAVNPEETRLFTGGGSGVVHMWDIQSGEAIWTSSENGHQSEVRKCHFSPDGSYVSSASGDRTIKVWRASSGDLIHTFQGHRDKVNNAVFDPTGERLISASKDGTLRIWDLHSETQASTSQDKTQEPTYTACEFSANGKLLVTASDDGSLRVWDVDRGSLVAEMKDHKSRLPDSTIGPSGYVAVSIASTPLLTDNALRSFDALTGQLLETMQPTHLSPESAEPGASGESAAALRARSTGIRKTSAWLQSCQFSPDGNWIAVGTADLMGNDNTIKLIDWHAKVLRQEFSGHKAPIYDCAFSPDSRFIASASSDASIRVWDLDSGETIHTLQGHMGPVFACRFSPDGRILLSASADWTLRLWDLETGAEIRSYEAHENPVWGCAFNGDGSLFISVSEDNTLKVWDTETGRCLTTLYTEGFLMDCDWHAQSNQIVAVGERGVYFLEVILPEP